VRLILASNPTYYYCITALLSQANRPLPHRSEVKIYGVPLVSNWYCRMIRRRWFQ